jgi:hypothetical protein
VKATAEESLKRELVSALSDTEVVHSNLLATVTRNCVIIPNPQGHAQTIVSLSRIISVRRIKSTYPGLVVIAAGLGLIAAAAACSKDGHGTALPIGLVGLGFAVSYIGTRRGAVALEVGVGPGKREVLETASGSLRDAAAIVRAIESGPERDESEAA